MGVGSHGPAHPPLLSRWEVEHPGLEPVSMWDASTAVSNFRCYATAPVPRLVFHTSVPPGHSDIEGNGRVTSSPVLELSKGLHVNKHGSRQLCYVLQHLNVFPWETWTLSAGFYKSHMLVAPVARP